MSPYKTHPLWTSVILLICWIYCLSFVEGQRLAVQKCDEYRKVALRKQTQLLLTLFPTGIEFESNNCSNVVQPTVGGEETKYGEFPHHALLGYPNMENMREFDFLCYGTLISDQHVLSAAHCFSEGDPTMVRLGEYDTTVATGEELDVAIAGILMHPQFKQIRPYHDIALIKLASRVTFTKLIRPACLWDTEERNITRYISTGFGPLEAFSQTLSPTMIKVQLDELSEDDCTEALNLNPRFSEGIDDGQMCVGSAFDASNTCRTLSGSPLLTVTSTNTCMYHVVGILSWGDICEHEKAKLMFTKVSHYLQWIEDNVWGPNAL